MIKASEVIAHIQHLIKERGDLPFCVGDDMFVYENIGIGVLTPNDGVKGHTYIGLKISIAEHFKNEKQSSQGSEKKVRSDKPGRASKPNKVQSAKNRGNASVPARRGKKAATVGKRKAAPVRAGKKKVERKSKA